MKTIRSSLPAWQVSVVLMAATLVACQHKPPESRPVPPTNVQSGDTLNVAAPIAFPPGAGLVFQNERIVPVGALSRDMPYCTLNPVGAAPRAIPPGPLTVNQVYYDERGSGGPGGTNSTTRISMRPPGTAPGAYDLVCGWPAGAAASGFLSIQQIFNAVGGSFSLGVPK